MKTWEQKKMKPRWSKHLITEEKQEAELKANYLDSALMRERLMDMLEEDSVRSLRRMRKAASGEIPNLSEYYAAELAIQDTLEKVMNLIN